MPDPFIHLRCHTAYSLLEGAIKPKALVGLCQEHQMPAIAITDHDNLFGSMEFSLEASGNGIQPIIGFQASLVPMRQETGIRNLKSQPDQLLLLAKDETGYANLMKLASQTFLEPAEGEGPLLTYETLAERNEGLIALTAGTYGAVGKALMANDLHGARDVIEHLQEVFGDRLYMEIMRHGLPDEKRIEADMLALAIDKDVPIVATNDIYFHGDQGMYEAHDALMCIAEGRYISEDKRRKLTPEHRFKTTEEMRLLFRDIPEAIDNSRVIAERCAIMSPPRKPILPSYNIERDGKKLSEEDALRELSKEGLEKRLEKHVFTESMSDTERAELAKPYRERLDYELDVIIQMGYPGYFLIVSDFISWSKEHGIPVGPGRGSGAASVVAWSLLITDLDPLKYELVFERFLNPERVSMPDFDIDFCQERRDEVIRYVQQKYGYDKVAQIITFGKLQARAVLRDVGRVLQMPYGQVDKICKLVPNNPANPVTLQEAIDVEPMLRRQMKEEEEVKHLVTLSLKLEGLYRHSSTHAAGVVIADRSLDELVALYRDPKSDMPVVQYSMKYAEIAGLVKFDFLGLKTLTVLSKAVQLISKRGIDIDLATIPLDDKATFELLTRGDSVGVFQFESAGMRDSLRKLKPDCVEDLIALGALYRPGPMDNIPTYINRKHGKEKPDYFHPLLEDVLKETYGVIIYQEQVQKIAQVLSGYTLGAADLLRRAMGKKIKEEMDKQRKIFVEGARENKVDEKQAESIFDLVAKFAGYGFNKAHAAAYALIGYQTAYLKANYPVEFFAASMTLDMHQTDKLAVLKEDAKRLGYTILPPDINKSDSVFGVEETEEGLAIRYALGALKNVGEQAMSLVAKERNEQGEFKDIFDLASRLDGRVMNKRQLEYIVKAGALDSIHPNRQQLFESLELLTSYNQTIVSEREANQINLFGDAKESHTKPALHRCSDWPPLERLENEFTAIGFYLSAHPLEGYKNVLKRLGAQRINRLAETLGKDYKPVTVAGIVTGYKVKTSDKGRFAFVQLSDASGAYEASIFNEELLNASRELLESGTLVLIKADAKGDESGPRLIITSIMDLQKKAQSVSGSVVDIMIESTDVLPDVRTLIGESKEKGSLVHVLCPTDDGYAQVSLQERYMIPPEVIQHLQSLPGIARVEEY